MSYMCVDSRALLKYLRVRFRVRVRVRVRFGVRVKFRVRVRLAPQIP